MSLLINIETWSDHVVWWHYVAVAIPNELRFTDTALILIGGGNNYADKYEFIICLYRYIEGGGGADTYFL